MNLNELRNDRNILKDPSILDNNYTDNNGMQVYNADGREYDYGVNDILHNYYSWELSVMHTEFQTPATAKKYVPMFYVLLVPILAVMLMCENPLSMISRVIGIAGAAYSYYALYYCKKHSCPVMGFIPIMMYIFVPLYLIACL